MLKLLLKFVFQAQVDDAAGKTEASTVLEKEDTIAIYGSNGIRCKSNHQR